MKTTKGRKWLYILVAVVALLLGFGLGWLVKPQVKNVQKVEIKQIDYDPVKICISKGGIPITSSWDGRLRECQFHD